LCFRTSICRIHCIDQFRTFTLLLKSKILDFETLSRVHVYRIEYVSYRQGPYRICIDTADDRIVPALTHLSVLLPLYNAFLLLVVSEIEFSIYWYVTSGTGRNCLEVFGKQLRIINCVLQQYTNKNIFPESVGVL